MRPPEVDVTTDISQRLQQRQSAGARHEQSADEKITTFRSKEAG
jgi:hypothetical protein